VLEGVLLAFLRTHIYKEKLHRYNITLMLHRWISFYSMHIF